jgi:hypothetical protein
MNTKALGVGYADKKLFAAINARFALREEAGC